MSAVQLDLLETAASLPQGFRYQPEVVSAEEAAAILEILPGLDFREFEFHGYFGKRRVVSFGLHYDFSGQALREAAPIPEFLLPLGRRAAVFAGVDPAALIHALVTEYSPGAAIGWHRDRPVFGDVIGMSFAAPCRFRFRRRQAGAHGAWERRAVILEPRSAYLLRGEARTQWEHSIPPAEALRYSITFRTIA